MDGSAICGSISLAVTPFLDHGAIDWNAFDPLMDFHASAGSGGFFALGGTSEMNGYKGQGFAFYVEERGRLWPAEMGVWTSVCIPMRSVPWWILAWIASFWLDPQG